MEQLLFEYLDKKPDFSSLSPMEQVKYMAYFFTKINNDLFFIPKNIDTMFNLACVNKPKDIPYMFKKLRGKDIFLPAKIGYKFHRDEIKKMEDEFSKSSPKKKISKTLRDLLPKINDANQKKFLEEAINCFEINAYRAAMIMTWLLILNNLQDFIIKNKLNEFDTALKKQNLKIKKISSKEDFLEMKESKFIEITRSAGIITKDVRKILDEKLGTRNSAAHPNTITFSEAKATSFIEDLVENVLLSYPAY